MMTVVALFLFASILVCVGILVKWEFKRAKRGPRFDPRSLQAEGPGVAYVPPPGPKRIFELDVRR